MEEVRQKYPQLHDLLSDFVSNVLLHKPEDVYSFANNYFTTFHSDPTADLQKNLNLTPLVINGPSGVGKGTLTTVAVIGMLLQEFPNLFGFSVSHTTRQPRDNEKHGVHYYFSTEEAMKKEISEGKFIEHAVVHGKLYGTSKMAVESVAKQGKICVLDIDVQGAEQVKKSSIRARYVFVAPPSIEELEKRLRGRGTETEESVHRRLKNAIGEIQYTKRPGFFDLILVNDDLKTAYKELKDWIFANVVNNKSEDNNNSGKSETTDTKENKDKASL